MELVNLMEVSLLFVEDANKAPDKLESYKETITQLLKEIGECCIFVRKSVEMQGRFLGNRCIYFSFD